MKALCFALFACAFNLLIGYVGLLVLRPRRLLRHRRLRHRLCGEGLGLRRRRSASSPAPPSAALLGTVFGWLAIRRQGIYFAMVTLALAQMVYFVALQAQIHRRRGRHPGGAARAPVRHRRPLRSLRCIIFVLAVFLVGFLLIYRTIHSPFGQVLKAIRENEPRAISLGYRTDRYKLLAFMLSATLAGLAGVDQGAGVPARLAHRRALARCRARWC